jgi:hypothetical protein
MHSCPCAHCAPRRSGREVAASLPRVGFRLGLRLFLRRLANASGRIEFIIFLIMDWLFASGCSPPHLSMTQLPSATDSQCSVRRGLSPRCWCALSGARRDGLRAVGLIISGRHKQGEKWDGTEAVPCPYIWYDKIENINN